MADFKTEEIDGKLHVYVTTASPPRTGAYQREKVYTPRVKEYLNKNNIKFGRMLKQDTAHNMFGNCIGHWIFEIPLDKSSEPVILKEEKPKTTRRRRTKKASTEE